VTFDDSALIHGKYYDRQKAHEYYLRTRMLKGRKTAAVPQVAPDQHASRVGAGSSNKSPQTRQASIDAQEAALRAKISRLESVLAELVNAAKARSGVDTKKKPSGSGKGSSKTSKSDKVDTPQTAAQKQKDAKRAHDYYEKHKPKGATPAQELQALEQRVREIKGRIQKALQAARQKPHAQSDQTAAQGR
jgi:hypothetical protein